MPGTPPIDMRMRINFAASRALGPGKVELLEHLASGGSLARALARADSARPRRVKKAGAGRRPARSRR